VTRPEPDATPAPDEAPPPDTITTEQAARTDVAERTRTSSCSGGGGDDPGAPPSPGDGSCEDIADAETCESTLWGKALKVGRKVLGAARRGDDLLDARTWKRIGREEWDQLVDCGIDALDATSGDTGALISTLNCAAGLTLGMDFFDMLRGLKAADRLGLDWYDDVMGYLRGSRYAGELVNNISDLDVVESVAIQGEKLFGKWVMPDGTSTRKIIRNFESKWGTAAELLDSDGRMILRSPSGNIIMTRYPSTNTDYFGIDINFVDENRILKIRADE
jgi:hypothetical protein